MNSQQPQLMAWLPKEGVDDMFKAGFPTWRVGFSRLERQGEWREDGRYLDRFPLARDAITLRGS